MSLPKSIIRGLLKPLGLRLMTLPDEPWAAEPLRFGPYVIHTHCLNMKRSYAEHPLTHQVIGRIVEALAELNQEMSMIDVGANCGDTAAIARTAAQVPLLCVEPDEILFELLKSNLATFPEVTFERCYLGEARESAQYALDKVGWNNSLVAVELPGAAVQEIEFRTLDDVVADWPQRKNLRFLKCDTEGFDVRVLHGAEELLRDKQPVLFFEYNRDAMNACGEEGLRVFPFLRGLGYQQLLVYDAYARLLLVTDL